MNKLIIIGNLTRDPVLNSTQNGIPVCNLSVAVNRRSGQQQTTDYFRVTTWRQTAENCARYLTKGSRVCCWGPVAVSTYQANDGTTRAGMDLNADGVEFCGATRRHQEGESAPDMQVDQASGMEQVNEELPF